MKQLYEIVHWPNGGIVQVTDTKEQADKLARAHGKNHIVREAWFTDDGERYDLRIAKGK